MSFATLYALLNLQTKTGSLARDYHKSHIQGNRMTRFKSYCVIFTLEIAIITETRFDNSFKLEDT